MDCHKLLINILIVFALLLVYIGAWVFYRERNGSYINFSEHGTVFCIDVGDGDGGRWEIPAFPVFMPAMYIESQFHKCSFNMVHIQSAEKFGETKYLVGVDFETGKKTKTFDRIPMITYYE